MPACMLLAVICRSSATQCMTKLLSVPGFDSQAELIEQGSKVPPALAVDLPTSTPLGALGVTLERSKQLCLQMYEKELFTDSSYQHVTAQLVCTPEQLAAFAGKRHLRSTCNINAWHHADLYAKAACFSVL